jgi:hypothetical protein
VRIIIAVIASGSEAIQRSMQGAWIASSLALPAMTSSLAPATRFRVRVAVTPAMRSHESFARRTDLRQSMPAVVTGIPTINASSHDM